MKSNQDDHTIMQIKRLLASQSLAALATQGSKGPYVNLIAFTAADNLAYVLFATPKTTRKYTNLCNTSQTALLVNNSQNQTADFHQAVAVTILGEAVEVTGRHRAPLVADYLKKHAYLESFVNSETCALIKVEVENYLLVENFQKVTEYFIK